MFYLILLLLFKCSSCVLNSATGDGNDISDNNPIIVPLQDYNVSTPGGESIDLFHTLPPHSLSKIILTKIPDDVNFVVLQVHSHLVNITLSLDQVPLLNNSIVGTNVGLVKMYYNADLTFYLKYNSSLEVMDVMVSVQAYSAKAPIPGGCNMEFPVEISPFLMTSYDYVTTDVNFAPSAPPISVLPESVITPSHECNIKPSPVHHEMFQRYFPERDFSRDTYFTILKSLMTRGRILANAYPVREKLTSPPMKRSFATYPGTGNAFVVVSHFGNQAAVYVPSFSYGCSELEEDNTCPVLTTTFSKVLCATVLFLGLFLCLFGHFFFTIEIFLLGFKASGIISYILVYNLFSSSIALTAAVSLGMLFPALVLVGCKLFRLPIISVVLASLVYGFLLASVICYAITDYVDVFVLDINFWGIFIGIVVSCPFLMTCLAEKANMLSCAFVGSYVAILSVDHYIGSNLRYIILNTIRRAVSGKFRLAIVGPPFQYKDIALTFTWLILAALGMALQMKLMRNKPPYPPPVNPFKSVYQRFIRPYENQPSERTPLVSNNRVSGLF